ncbi:MAG: hypothetical protein WC560_09265 [Syntrophales bacterium]
MMDSDRLKKEEIFKDLSFEELEKIASIGLKVMNQIASVISERLRLVAKGE